MKLETPCTECAFIIPYRPPWAKWQRLVVLVLLVVAISRNASAVNQLPQAMIDRAYSFAVPARGGEGNLSWRTEGELPPGLALADGQITGTPKKIGKWQFNILVTDELGNQAEPARYLLEVTPPPAPYLALRTRKLPIAVKGELYEFDLSAEGGSPPYRWEIARGELPAWMSLKTNAIEGIPDKVGMHSVVFRVTDSLNEQAESDQLTLEVKESSLFRPLRVLTEVLPDAYVRIPYNANLVADGGLPPYSWAIDNPPSWVELRDNVLQGKPLNPSEYLLRITVTDAENRRVEQRSVKLSVTDPPIVEPLAVLTKPLPVAFVGEQYVARIAVAGGLPPYSIEVIGRLPDGISLDRDDFLMGTPVSAGVWEITPSASDSLGHSSSGGQPLFLQVKEIGQSPLEVAVTSPLVAIRNEPFKYEVMVLGGLKPYHIEFRGRMPPGLRWYGKTHEIQGTPTRSGEWHTVIHVRDSGSDAVDQGFPVRIVVLVRRSQFWQWATSSTLLVLGGLLSATAWRLRKWRKTRKILPSAETQ